MAVAWRRPWPSRPTAGKSEGGGTEMSWRGEEKGDREKEGGRGGEGTEREQWHSHGLTSIRPPPLASTLALLRAKGRERERERKDGRCCRQVTDVERRVYRTPWMVEDGLLLPTNTCKKSYAGGPGVDSPTIKSADLMNRKVSYELLGRKVESPSSSPGSSFYTCFMELFGLPDRVCWDKNYEQPSGKSWRKDAGYIVN